MCVRRLLICSVGTSILSGRTKDKEKPWSWRPNGEDKLPDPALVDDWLKDATPFDAGAEINTLSRLDVGDSDRIVFLHSDTAPGEYCAERLANYFKTRCRSVELKRLTHLGYGARSFTQGLKSLINITCDLVNNARQAGEEVVICATGGFKVEIAFLNLLGALLEVPVAYMYEEHDELVVLPRLPLAWDTEFVERNRSFFEWIEDGDELRRTVEVESWLKREPALRELVEHHDDGYTVLSAAGLLLYRASQKRVDTEPVEWPDPTPITPEEKHKGFSEEPHKRPHGWENLISLLSRDVFVTAVKYDNEQRMRHGERVRILDPENGVIGVRYGPPGDELPIRVYTTARGEAQTQLLVNHIRSRIGKKLGFQ